VRVRAYVRTCVRGGETDFAIKGNAGQTQIIRVQGHLVVLVLCRRTFNEPERQISYLVPVVKVH
jgi:hypothetical protein